MKSPPRHPSARFRRILRRLGLGLILLVLVLWVLHPVLLVRVARLGLSQWARSTGMQWTANAIQMERGGPLVINNLDLQAKDPATTETALQVDRITLDFPSLWNLLVHQASPVRSLTVDGLRGVLDLRHERAGAWVPPPEAEQMHWQRVHLKIFATSWEAEVDNLSAHFSEDTIGRISIETVSVRTPHHQLEMGPLEGLTAWKDGVWYLADLPLQKGLTLENFRFSPRKGRTFGLQAAVAGGSLWMDGALDGREVDVALSASGIDLAPVSGWLGLPGRAEGLLQEGRLTFRGDPAKPLQGQASLRILARGVRWNQRGWETLTVGANLIHRRLVLNNFELRQKENSVTANGEMSLDEEWPSVARAPFLLNISATLRDLGTLGTLVGPPFEQMSGRMTLSSSISGRKGCLKGFLSLEATGIKLWKRTFESGRIEVTFAGDEVRVAHGEFWSGPDHLSADGTIALAVPHAYSGRVKLQVRDVGAYRAFFPLLERGAVQLDWEGDGTRRSHSGAFSLGLKDWVSSFTPGGLTGTFEGTYSPENIYFRNLDLRRKGTRLTTTATLARSGLGFKEITLRKEKRLVATAEMFLPLNPFALLAGASTRRALVRDKPFYLRLETKHPLPLRDLLRLGGQTDFLGGTLSGTLTAEGPWPALQVTGKLTGRDLSAKGIRDWRGVRGSVTGRGHRLSVGPLTGQIEGGNFVAQGTVDFSVAKAPGFHFGFLGRNLRVEPKTSPTDLRADADLQGSGNTSGGTLTGWVRLRANGAAGSVPAFLHPGPLAQIFGGPPRFSRTLPLSWKNEVVVSGRPPIPLWTTKCGPERPTEISLAAMFATPQWHRANLPQ